jgi:hypothetical protein
VLWQVTARHAAAAPYTAPPLCTEALPEQGPIQCNMPVVMLSAHLRMLCWWWALASSLLSAALLHARRCCTVPACLLRPLGPSSLQVSSICQV